MKSLSRLSLLAAVAAFAVLGSTTVSHGQAAGNKQDPKKQEAKKADPPKEEPKKEEPKKEEPKKDPKVADYEKAIKDLPKFDGPFTMYTRKKDILLEIPEDKLGKLWYLQATFNTGIGTFLGAPGMPLNQIDVFRLDRAGEDKVTLVRPNLKYRWSDNDPNVVSARRSFPEALLTDFRIEQTNPEKKLLLLNVTSLFYGDLFRLNELVAIAGAGAFGVDREKSGVDRIKSYGDNTILRMNLHYQALRGAPQGGFSLFGLTFQNTLEDDRSAPFKLTYNLYYDKPSDYQPRLADSRVGFITEDHMTMAKYNEKDRMNRYIARFNLRKKDPTAAMSEPVSPIVWYVDNSFPKNMRGAAREGIERWNKAFEAIGYKNAIVVKDAPDNDPDWDHADTRFNVVRWHVNQEDAGAVAVAWLRPNPITGETLNAAVTIDANWFMVGLRGFENEAAPVKTQVQTGLKALVRGTESMDAYHTLMGTPDRVSTSSKFEATAKKYGWSQHGVECHYAEGLAHQSAVAYFAGLASGFGVDKETYAKELVTEVVCHEVGHCLGLQHNFAGSTNLTTAQLADDAIVAKEGLTASIMDYTGANLAAILKGGKTAFSPTIGAYDKWIIQYGYGDRTANTPEGEKPNLRRIASQYGMPGHFFMNDDDADSFDPQVVRYDMAKDPLNWFAIVLETARRAQDYAVKNLPKYGEDYSERNNLIFRSQIVAYREGLTVSRFVGGVLGNRHHRGDLGERPTLQPVPVAQQRQAMDLILGKLLSRSSVGVPQSVLLSMSGNYTDGSGSGFTAPIRDIIGGQQIRLLATLLSAAKLDLIAENAFKLEGTADAYTMSEHFNRISSAVFAEIYKPKPVAGTRRDLQRFAVEAMITIAGAPAGGVNDDARAMAGDVLLRLEDALKKAGKGSGYDSMTAAHFRDLQASIDRFQDRKMVSNR